MESLKTLPGYKGLGGMMADKWRSIPFLNPNLRFLREHESFGFSNPRGAQAQLRMDMLWNFIKYFAPVGKDLLKIEKALRHCGRILLP
jgi:hypothetical protein